MELAQYSTGEGKEEKTKKLDGFTRNDKAAKITDWSPTLTCVSHD
jgi:hypothetical protein